MVIFLREGDPKTRYGQPIATPVSNDQLAQVMLMDHHIPASKIVDIQPINPPPLPKRGHPAHSRIARYVTDSLR